MSDSPYIFDATMENFQQKVMESAVPVLIDVWAEGHEPCAQLSPVLERLAEEYQGQFILARVNAGEQQQLAGSLGVRSLPTVLLVKGGQAVDGFADALPESEIRKILEKHVEAPPEDPYDKANRQWEEGDLEGALATLTEMNRNDPNDTRVLIDIAQLKAELGDVDTAEQVYDSLAPEDKLQHKAKQLAARIRFLRQSGELPPVAKLEARLEKDPNDAEALHQLALQHVLQENNGQAMELLIRLIQTAPDYKDGIGKTTLVELFEKLGNSDPEVRTYRRKLYTLMH